MANRTLIVTTILVWKDVHGWQKSFGHFDGSSNAEVAFCRKILTSCTRNPTNLFTEMTALKVTAWTCSKSSPTFWDSLTR